MTIVSIAQMMTKGESEKGEEVICGEEMICAGTEDGDVIWIALSFGKMVASTSKALGAAADSVVSHKSPISCCRYFHTAPLVATADAESTVILWSLIMYFHCGLS